MTTPIDQDVAEILQYLRTQVQIPDPAYMRNVQKYESRWRRYGYDIEDAARALEWYRKCCSQSRESRPKPIDEALSASCMEDARSRYVTAPTNRPCATCQHLHPECKSARGVNCARLLIWVAADPTKSTCPQWSAIGNENI